MYAEFHPRHNVMLKFKLQLNCFIWPTDSVVSLMGYILHLTVVRDIFIAVIKQYANTVKDKTSYYAFIFQN